MNLEQRIRAKCPELMELSFGCEVRTPDNRIVTVLCADPEIKCIYNGNIEYLDYKYEILGHPIRLEHVLKCLWGGAYRHANFVIDGGGQFYPQLSEDRIYDGKGEQILRGNSFGYSDMYPSEYPIYNLNLPFSEQAPETIEWLDKHITI